MISFELTEEQAIARAAAADFAQSTLTPAARAADEAARIASPTLSETWTLGIVQAVADPSFRTMERYYRCRRRRGWTRHCHSRQ